MWFTKALCLISLLAAVPAQAFDCEFYQTCCWEYVAAIEEAGSPPSSVEPVEQACTMHLGLPEGGVRHYYCVTAWERMSIEIYDQYMRGIIGFYPESCMADPLADPDEILEPDPAIPEPDPEEEGL